MDNLNLNQHISKKFNEELEDIRARVLKMGGIVEQQLKDAITSLSEMNQSLAETVVRNDYKVNALEVSIDEECTQILARRQPTASDLRLVIAVIKTITDLERIGDEAGRVAKMAIHFSETKGHDNLLGGILHLAEQVSEMLHGALDAFARMDTHSAVKVAQSDSKADREYERILRELMTFMMEDPRFIPYILDVMWSARALERIGDRACNICEYVIYLVNGKDVRHTSLEQSLADNKNEK